MSYINIETVKAEFDAAQRKVGDLDNWARRWGRLLLAELEATRLALMASALNQATREEKEGLT